MKVRVKVKKRTDEEVARVLRESQERTREQVERELEAERGKVEWPW